jgi:GxxExxY protein
MAELILREEVYQIVGAAMEVYYKMGRGFLEPVYQEALEIELLRRRIPFSPHDKLFLYYKRQRLKKKYVPDFTCFGQIIVELKVCEALGGPEVAQLLNYLKASGHHLGLLVNFGSAPRLEWRRYVL